MDNHEIKVFLVTAMGISLIGAAFFPIVILAFIVSAALFFGVTLLEVRHSDTIKSVKEDLDTLNGAFGERMSELEGEIAKLEIGQIKADVKTLIESNNQLVMKSMGSGNQFGAFGGMS